MSTEQFNDIPPLRDDDGDPIFEIELDSIRHIGELWTGITWLSVAQARELRAWLDRAIP